MISNKTVAFLIDGDFSIPKDLIEFNPSKDGNKLTLQYDKNKTNIKTIINIMNKLEIDFREINTYESDLEDVFLKLIRENKN